MDKVKTPKMLWQDYNAEILSLETNTVNTAVKNGLVTARVYFTGRQFDDNTKSRVYGVVCYKEGCEKMPAVLYIGKPDAEIDLNQLAYFADNGFVAMAVDLKGKSTKGHFSIYPPKIEYADYSGDDFAITNSAKETKWYEYSVNCMRAVTYLKQQNFVSSVSVVTMGKGSTVGLAVMAIDKRIASGAVVFGNLRIQAGGYTEVNENSDMQQVAHAIAKNELLDIYNTGIAPQSYVPLIDIPVYVVCSGNSREADVTTVSDTFPRLNASCRLLILPGALDYLTDNIANGMLNWLNGKAAENDMQLTVEDGGDAPKIKLTTGSSIENLELWYTRDNKRICKHWVIAPLVKENGSYCASLDLYENNSNVSVVAVKNGAIAVSTTLLNFTVKNQYALKQPTSLLYSGESAQRFVAVSRDSWHGPELFSNSVKGYLDIRGAKGNAFCTFAAADKSVTADDCDTLSFDVCCDVKQTITVKYCCGFGMSNQIYSATVQIFGDGKWQRIALNKAQFKREKDGHSLPKEFDIEIIMFFATEKFIINNVYLV